MTIELLSWVADKQLADHRPAGLVADKHLAEHTPAGRVADKQLADHRPAGLVADKHLAEHRPAGWVVNKRLTEMVGRQRQERSLHDFVFSPYFLRDEHSPSTTS